MLGEFQEEVGQLVVHNSVIPKASEGIVYTDKQIFSFRWIDT